MAKKCGIYKISSPSGRVYIGQSRNIEERFRRYLKMHSSNKTQIRLTRSFLKYGVKTHIFETIEECPLTLLNERERFWQDHYDVLNGGLNCVLTATDVLPRVMSEEMRVKRSGVNHWAWGKEMSKESKTKMSNSAKERKASEETKAILSRVRTGQGNQFFGKKHSEKTKKHLSEKKKGVNNIRSKLILDTQTGIFYFGTQEAAEAIGIKYNTLYFQLSGRNKNKTNLIYI